MSAWAKKSPADEAGLSDLCVVPERSGRLLAYNLVKIYKSIKTTPAMETRMTDFLWGMEDIVAMSETYCV